MNRVSLAQHMVRKDRALLKDYLRYFLESKFHRDTSLPGDAPSEADAVDLDDAYTHIRASVGPWADGPALEVVRRHVDQLPKILASDETATLSCVMGGDTSLCELIYALVRALQPESIVETGVATGMTTAYLLAALTDNNAGRLHSIDLPTTVHGQVAVAVPPSLRARWTYHWGSSRRLLPPLLARMRGTLDLFIHDSDHRYAAMRWELEQAYQALSPGGWLVADDAGFHSAFQDFSEAVRLTPLYVRQGSKESQTPSLTGMLSARLEPTLVQ